MIEQYWVGIFDVNTSESIVQLNKINATVLSLRKYTSYNFDALLNIYLELTIKDLMKYTLGLILLTPSLALEIILNDTKVSISELNRLDTVFKRSKKDRLINELNEAKKNY